MDTITLTITTTLLLTTEELPYHGDGIRMWIGYERPITGVYLYKIIESRYILGSPCYAFIGQVRTLMITDTLVAAFFFNKPGETYYKSQYVLKDRVGITMSWDMGVRIT
jgi:hypothetical protein